MSTSPEFELDIDLHFLPAWAQQPAATNRYAKYEGGPERDDRRGDRRGPPGSRPPRRDDRGPRRDTGPRRDGPPGGGAPRGASGGGDRRPQGGDRGGFRRRDDRGPVENLPPLPDLMVVFIPEEKGVESIARQIKLTGRAYPLFGVGQMILKKPDRFHLQFSTIKLPDGKISQELWTCNLDETVWLSEADAIQHVLAKHFDTFYQSEKIPTDPPKGVYTFVAQCGMSGVILGPPNYHDYQNKLRKLHTERFSRMPFEAFKSRVKIVKDEAIVKQWVEDQSFRTEFNCLNVPEPLKLNSREDVQKHFREVHLPNILKQVDRYTITEPAGRDKLPRPLQALARRAWEDQKRFPIKVVTLLSQQFAGHGLQFFKVNKTITHVAVARPHFLDMEATPVSTGVKRIVDFINATPNCTRRALIEALAPSAAPIVAEGAAATEPAEAAAPTPEQSALVSDLHWLIHQGHVIEFADGKMETAKKPAPKPVKQPAAKPAGNAPVAAASESAVAENTTEEVSAEAAAAEAVAEAPVEPEPAAETSESEPKQ